MYTRYIKGENVIYREWGTITLFCTHHPSGLIHHKCILIRHAGPYYFYHDLTWYDANWMIRFDPLLYGWLVCLQLISPCYTSCPQL